MTAALRAVLVLLVNTVRFHKLKILGVVIGALALFLILFPYEDLGDWLSARIAEGSQNQLFLQFDSLGVSFFPVLAAEMENVDVDTPNFPTLHAERVRIAPSISSLLRFRKGLSADAEGLFGGDLSFSLREGKPLTEESSNRSLQIEAEHQNVDLKVFGEFLQLPVIVEGIGRLVVSATLDPTFADQPQGELEVSITKLRMPPAPIPTQFGPMTLPGLQFSTAHAKARMAARDLVLEEVRLGETSEPLSARLKGQIGLDIKDFQGRPQAIFGAYDLRVELNLSKAMEKEREVATFVSLLSKFRNPTLNGSRYAFRLRATSLQGAPEMQAISSF